MSTLKKKKGAVPQGKLERAQQGHRFETTMDA